MIMQVLCMPLVKVKQKHKFLCCNVSNVESGNCHKSIRAALDVSDSELPASVKCSNCGKNNHSADQCWNSTKKPFWEQTIQQQTVWEQQQPTPKNCCSKC